MSSFFDTDLYKIGAPIAGYIGGLLTLFVQRYTLTKKEKSDLNQKIYENTNQLLKDQSDKYQDFVNALNKYANKSTNIEIEDFVSIAMTGDKYFYQQVITANAILSGMIKDEARDNTFVPKLVDSVDRLLPRYYATLQKIAKEKNFNYDGRLVRANYESIFKVVDQYRPLLTIKIHK